MLMLNDLFLEGNSCGHQDRIYNSNCSHCGMSQTQVDEQDKFSLFVWRRLLKMLPLEWKTLKAEYMEKINSIKQIECRVAFLSHGSMSGARYTKFFVVDGWEVNDLYRFNKALYEVYGKDEVGIRYAGKIRQTVGAIDLFDPNRGSQVDCSRFYFYHAKRKHVPSEGLQLKIIHKYDDGKFSKWIRDKSKQDFVLWISKNEEIRSKTKSSNLGRSVEIFNLTDQQLIARVALKNIFEARINEALELFGCTVAKHIHSTTEYVNFDSWKNLPRYYLILINSMGATDSDLDKTGKKLYDGLVDFLGKEKAKEFLSNTSLYKNCSSGRRLALVYDQDENDLALALVDEDIKIRELAKRKLKNA